MSRHEVETPTPGLECPICGHKVATFMELARHMAGKHAGHEIGGNSLIVDHRYADRAPVVSDLVWVDCWCGESFFTMSQWASHLIARGMPLHFLNGVFGVDMLTFGN